MRYLPKFDCNKLNVSNKINNCRFVYRNNSTNVTASFQSTSFIANRLELWNKLKENYQNKIENKTSRKVSVKLNGFNCEANTWKDTPFKIINDTNKKLLNSAIVAKVNGIFWDLNRPIENDCELEVITFNDLFGKQVFWHSSAYVLGAALEQKYGALLHRGPSTENGFYYDSFIDGKMLSAEDITELERSAEQIIKDKQQFERIEVTKSDLMEMFAYNKYKLRIIEQQIHSETATLYRCGNLIDMCRGPHLRHTGLINQIAFIKRSPTFWNENTERLERVYGISFPTKEEMKEWKQLCEKAEKRDHRKIGQDQELFFFHEYSPGSCFFQPKGTHIYNTLIEFLKKEYRKRGYHEVITPNIYKTALWKISGHWDHYAGNMFSFKTERDTFALKPMNCPGHCLIFANDVRSYRELPLRYADFGVLHRNEFSGGLTGLTRVRRFQQDDAHIFCTTEQIQSEIDGCLDFLSYVYKTLGFTFELQLSTRPDDFIGDVATWVHAEKALEQSLNKFGLPWKFNHGDGAFYGPKIDITISDALKRNHQCATIQLDFQLPERFDLAYDAGDGNKNTRPVIIHRAIFGSVERLMAILTESFGGKWPFWLSPRQAIVIPIHPSHNEYAIKVRNKLSNAGYAVESDLNEHVKMNKKIRRAQLAQFNFILCVGEKENETNSVTVRTRNNKVHGMILTKELIEKFNLLRDQFTLGEDVF